MTVPATIRVTDAWIEVPAGARPDTTYDVVINGQHVWSILPERDAESRAGSQVVPWPKSMRRHLVGMADVLLRGHVDGVVIGSGSHAFEGRDDRRVAVVDKAGRPLVIDKYGALIPPLSAEGTGALDSLLDDVAALLTTLREECGVPAFISYGTLLGAARNGRLIGHDNDVDITYVSLHQNPVDVIREGYRVERALTAAGWRVRRGSGTRLNVRLPQTDGTMRYVDVFTAHWVDGVLYTPQDTGFRLPTETLLPLTTLELHGRPMPVPADYERLLAETYGPGWRVPDPSFQYDTPEWLSRRINGWFGGLRVRRKLWDKFYGGAGRKVVSTPSPFARWVSETHPSERLLVDLGTGNGRDALWFARQRRRVLALDFTVGTLGRLSRQPRFANRPIELQSLNLCDSREVLALGTRLSREPGGVDLYARFLLHALEPEARENLARLASMSLRQGGLLFLEFRTPRDRRTKHHFQQPRRLYVAVDDARALVEARGGRVLTCEVGHGLAPYEDEDPVVCRMVVSWTD